jgi:hypothetical protein
MEWFTSVLRLQWQQLLHLVALYLLWRLLLLPVLLLQVGLMGSLLSSVLQREQ